MILFAIIVAAILVAFAVKAAAKQAYRWDNAGWTPRKVVLVCAVVIAAILAWASGLHAHGAEAGTGTIIVYRPWSLTGAAVG